MLQVEINETKKGEKEDTSLMVVKRDVPEPGHHKSDKRGKKAGIQGS